MSAAAKIDTGGFSMVSEPSQAHGGFSLVSEPDHANDDGGFSVVSEPQSSTAGAFARGAERGALPAAGGLAGFAAGAAAAQPVVAPVAAMTGPAAPIVEGVGTFLGGAAGAYGGATAVQKAQDWALEHMPDEFVKALGLDKAQQAADVKEHPIASFTGELAPNLALVRPGAVAKTVEEGAPAVEKLFSHPITARAVPAAVMASQEAANEEINTGTLDPEKIAIAAGVGAVSNRETALGKMVGRAGAAPVDAAVNLARGERPTAAPSPDEVAAPVLAADSVDQAISAARAAADSTPINIDSAAFEAEIAGGAQKPSPAADEAAEIDDSVPPEQPTPDIHDVARQIDPATFQQYDALITRQDSYRAWLGQLADDRATSPAAQAAQGQIDSLLNKVGGVEDRLTASQATRLDAARADLDAATRQDTPDMAMVRGRLLEVQHGLFDVAPRVQAAMREAERQSPAVAEAHEQVAPEAASRVEDGAQPEAASAPPEAPSAGPRLPTLDEATEAPDQAGAPQRVTARPLVADRVPTRSAPVRPDAALAEPTTFATAKGSTYEVHQDGTTTRDKAARSDLGHEGQSGPQPRSDSTFYVTKEHADELGLFQTQGGHRMAVAERPDGTVGVKYLDGPGTGKFERRTVAKPSREPAPGLIPVETWKDGTRVHFGNEITSVSGGQEVIEPRPRALSLKTVEGTGEERERAVNSETYNVGEEAPQKEAAQRMVDKDYDQAVAVALRQKQPPAGVHPEFVYMAVEAKATRDGDAALIARLNRSRLAEEATIMGQRIGAWKNRDPLSAVAHVDAVADARAAALASGGRDVAKATAREAANIGEQFKAARKTAAASRPRASWDSFIDSLTCAGE